MFETCKTILFVDFENTGTVDLGRIPEDVFVPFFFGASQKSVPTNFLKAALKLGESFKTVDIEGQGDNALDFHIAFYLGEYLATNPKAACIILSKDKGFDPLVKHLSGRRFAVRRVGTLSEAFAPHVSLNAEQPKTAAATSPATSTQASPAKPPKPKAEKPAVSAYGSVLEHLKEMPTKSLPKKRKTLMSHLNNHFAKKIPEAELRKVVDRMVAEKKVIESEGKMGYQF